MLRNKYAYSKTGWADFLDIGYSQKRHYSELIKSILHLTNCQTYLEIGVFEGDNIYIARNEVKKCVAVDTEDLLKDKDDIIFYHTNSDEFFLKNTDTFDIIFIDGDHHSVQVIKDFENSLKVLNEFGIIIIHDTDPIDERLIRDAYCSDSYKIVDYILSRHYELNIMTFPITEMGLSFVMRKKDRRTNKYKKQWD